MWRISEGPSPHLHNLHIFWKGVYDVHMTIMGSTHPSQRVALGIARYVRRYGANPLTRLELYRGTAARDRQFFEEALALAEVAKFVRRVPRYGNRGQGWAPGLVNPEHDAFSGKHCGTCTCQTQ